MRNRIKILFLTCALAIHCPGLSSAAGEAEEDIVNESSLLDEPDFRGRIRYLQDVACSRITGKITVDAVLDEADWKVAGRIVPMLGVLSYDTVLVDKGQAGPGLLTDMTECRVMCDDTFLYFGIKCGERYIGDMQILTGGDSYKTWVQDSIEIYIDPKRDKRTYYHLMLAAGGGRMSQKGDYIDSTAKPLTAIKYEWKARIDEKGKAWYLEVKIGFDQIGLDASTGTAFGFNIERKDFATRAEEEPRSFWADPKFAIGKPPHANPAYYGTVTVGAELEVGAISLEGDGVYRADRIKVDCRNATAAPLTVKVEARVLKSVYGKKPGEEGSEKIVSQNTTTLTVEPYANASPAVKLDIQRAGQYILRLKVTDAKAGTSFLSVKYGLDIYKK